MRGNNPRMLDLHCALRRGNGIHRSRLHYRERICFRLEAAPARASRCRSAGNCRRRFAARAIARELQPAHLRFRPRSRSGLNLGTVARVTDWPRELALQPGSSGALSGSMRRTKRRLSANRAAESRTFWFSTPNHYVFQRFHRAVSALHRDAIPMCMCGKAGREWARTAAIEASVWKYNEDLLRSFFAYDQEDHSLVTVVPEHAVDLTSEGRSARYKDGHWGAMDYTGIVDRRLSRRDSFRSALRPIRRRLGGLRSHERSLLRSGRRADAAEGFL